MKKQLLLLATASLTHINTSAQPAINSVSGSVQDGQTITITGSGFGSSSPNVVLFDDFESGTMGTKIKTGVGSAKHGEWYSSPPVEIGTYNGLNKVSGAKAARINIDPALKSFGGTQISARFPKTRDFFISYWCFIPTGDLWPGENHIDGENWKILWVFGDNASNDGPGDWSIPTRLSTSNLVTGNSVATHATTPKGSAYVNVGLQKGEWKRIWCWQKASTDWNIYDGEMKFWVLQSGGVAQLINKINVSTAGASPAHYFNQMNVNGYVRRVTPSHPTFDDVYLAIGPNAQARVEIGNNTTYANCTNLTILTPTSWSASSISAQVNAGSFSDCDQVYLYVVDKDGKMNPNGYPVTIAGSGCTNSIEKNKENNIQLYPNPTSGFLTIEGIPTTNQITLTMKNILGKEVEINHNHYSDNIKVRTEHLPTGIYFLTISYNDQKSVHKIIKN